MKISELINLLEQTRLEYGDLNVQLDIWFRTPAGVEDWLTGDIDDSYIEERTNLCLVSDLREEG